MTSVQHPDVSAVSRTSNHYFTPTRFCKLVFDSDVVVCVQSLLDPRISTGIIIKLLSPFPYYTDEHNAFVNSIPAHIRELVSVIKQNYKAEWGADWCSPLFGLVLELELEPVLARFFHSVAFFSFLS